MESGSSENSKSILNTFSSNKADHPIADGTFIQWNLARGWDDEKWMSEYSYLREAGMNYLVLAPVTYADSGSKYESIYPTSVPGCEMIKDTHDMVDICLRNAEKAGVKVFLGLNFHNEWWSRHADDDQWLYDQMKVGNDVADELLKNYRHKYSNAFFGWYWVWEVDNLNFRGREERDVLAKALNTNLDHLNAMKERLPFMQCPFMNHLCGTAKEYRDMWIDIFSRTNFAYDDIFCPQDSVGARGLNMENFAEWLERLGEAVKTKPGLKYWIDMETFDQADWTSATIDRFVKQIKTASKYAENAITFAYSHYYSPNNNSDGYHKAYMQYVKNGSIPSGSPKDPANLQITGKNDEIIQLRWDHPENTSDICGYFIYHNGTLIGRNQLKRLESGKGLFLENEFEYDIKDAGDMCVYEVKAYDFAGNISKQGAKYIYHRSSKK